MERGLKVSSGILCARRIAVHRRHGIVELEQSSRERPHRSQQAPSILLSVRGQRRAARRCVPRMSRRHLAFAWEVGPAWTPGPVRPPAGAPALLRNALKNCHLVSSVDPLSHQPIMRRAEKPQMRSPAKAKWRRVLRGTPCCPARFHPLTDDLTHASLRTQRLCTLTRTLA